MGIQETRQGIAGPLCTFRAYLVYLSFGSRQTIAAHRKAPTLRGSDLDLFLEPFSLRGCRTL